MGKTRPPYPAEFRRRILDLVRAGRTPESLAQEFQLSAQTVRNWGKQAALDAGERSDGLSTSEREEFNRLRRENRRLLRDREILKKSGDLVRQGGRVRPQEGFEFVNVNRATFDVAAALEVLGLFGAWQRSEPPSARSSTHGSSCGCVRSTGPRAARTGVDACTPTLWPKASPSAGTALGVCCLRPVCKGQPRRGADGPRGHVQAVGRGPPESYLADVLVRVGTTPVSRIGALTPRGWKQERARAP